MRRRRMVKTRKVRICLFISEELEAKLRALINQKYKLYEKGLLSNEVELALRNWIALHTNAQTTLDINPPNPTPKVALVFAQVKQYLLNNWYYELLPGQQIPLTHLEKAIMAVRGSDKRTVRRWLESFHKMGLVKPITASVWELL
jgi:hypothetical protein